MSDKERVSALLDALPEPKLGMVIAYIQGLLDDEAEDDRFCQELYRDYLNDPDPAKHDTVSVEDLAEQLGVKLE